MKMLIRSARVGSYESPITAERARAGARLVTSQRRSFSPRQTLTAAIMLHAVVTMATPDRDTDRGRRDRLNQEATVPRTS